MSVILLDPRLIVIHSWILSSDPLSITIKFISTLSIIYATSKAIKSIYKHGISKSIELLIITILKTVPGGNKIIQKELEKTKSNLKKLINEKFPKSKHKNFYNLPENGISRETIREELLHQLAQEKSVANQRGHGGIYIKINDKYDKYLNNPKMTDFIDKNLTIKEEAYLYFSHTNCLYPFLFPGIRKFDIELISMAANMLNASEPAGNITSGGQESIFLAMNCWKNYGLKVKGIKKPNIILPITAHPAFNKACHYLDIDIKFIPFNNKTYTVDLKKLKNSIDSNTICIVTSAPCFGYSVIDDIEEICNIAKRKGNIPVHVDNCLGGFVLSFLYDMNIIKQPFDFRIDGVWSISCDLHKQVGSDKGCSVIIYDKFEYRKYQYYSYVNWPGGLYCSAGFQGSSNGGIKAVAWSVLLNKGKNTLKKNAMKLYKSIEYLKKEINDKILNCDIMGEPFACGLAFKFKNHLFELDYAISEVMQEIGGWEIYKLQFPMALFFQNGHNWIDQMDAFVQDLQKAIKIVEENPNKYKNSGIASVYGTAAALPDRDLVVQTCYDYLDVIHTPHDASK